MISKIKSGQLFLSVLFLFFLFLNRLGNFPSALHLSLYKFIDCLIQKFNRLVVSFFYCMDNAMIQMILKHYLAGIIDRRADRRELDQHFTAILVALYHAFDCLQMPNDSGQSVDDCFFLRGIVNMFVMTAVRMRMLCMGMKVRMYIPMRMLLLHLFYICVLIPCHFILIHILTFIV